MIEKNPAQIIPSAANGEPLSDTDASGKQSLRTTSADGRTQTEILLSIETLLARQVWMMQKKFEMDSCEVTSKDI